MRTGHEPQGAELRRYMAATYTPESVREAERLDELKRKDEESEEREE